MRGLPVCVDAGTPNPRWFRHLITWSVNRYGNWRLPDFGETFTPGSMEFPIVSLDELCRHLQDSAIPRYNIIHALGGRICQALPDVYQRAEDCISNDDDLEFCRQAAMRLVAAFRGHKSAWNSGAQTYLLSILGREDYWKLTLESTSYAAVKALLSGDPVHAPRLYELLRDLAEIDSSVGAHADIPEEIEKDIEAAKQLCLDMVTDRPEANGRSKLEISSEGIRAFVRYDDADSK